MSFKSLELNDWRQFEHVGLDFHNQLTILTGANGSGKTTLLNILARHLNWNVNIVGTPRKDKKTGAIRYRSERKKRPSDVPGGWTDIGRITYENGAASQIQAPAEASSQYNLNVLTQQPISGLHISSHRPIFSYQPVLNIPTQVVTRQQAYLEYFGSVYTRYIGQQSPKSPNQILKESLISLALFGGGNEYVTPNDDSRATFEGFQEVLRKVLPPKIGFKRLSIQVPEVVLETASGPFSLDAVSGGVASIIDLAWRIFMYSPEGDHFVCTIDEPENHLHPELQQSLLPKLIQTFPHVQFVIATHSPFMISAVYDSFVYVLDYNVENRVESQKLEAVNKAGTANEILRDVLGLPFTMPLWAEEKLDTIVKRYAEVGVDDRNVGALEAELSAAGLDFLTSDRTVSRSLERHDNDQA